MYVVELFGRTFFVEVEHDEDEGGKFTTFDIQAEDGGEVTYVHREEIKRLYAKGEL